MPADPTNVIRALLGQCCALSEATGQGKCPIPVLSKWRGKVIFNLHRPEKGQGLP